MYPIFSPAKLDVRIKILSNNKTFISPIYKFSSSSNKPLTITVNDFVNLKKIKNISAFSVVATSKNNKIPTRINHQLIYGDIDKHNSIRCSINLSLTNKKIFVPKKKTSFVWGQIINHKDYTSKLGICFKNLDGEEDKVKISLYSDQGKIKTISKKLLPSQSLIFDVNKILKNINKFNFCWYNAESKRSDLSAYSFHINKKSGNSSGEHNF